MVVGCGMRGETGAVAFNEQNNMGHSLQRRKELIQSCETWPTAGTTSAVGESGNRCRPTPSAVASAAAK